MRVTALFLLSLSTIFLAACTSAQTQTVVVLRAAPAPSVPVAPASKPEATCVRLFSSSSVPMTDARYRWTAGARSKEGETHSGWVIIDASVHERVVSLEWGPLVDQVHAGEPYPYSSQVEVTAGQGTREERADKMLTNLGYAGDLDDKLRVFESREHLEEIGLSHGRIADATWERLVKVFEDTIRDPNLPAECSD